MVNAIPAHFDVAAALERVPYWRIGLPKHQAPDPDRTVATVFHMIRKSSFSDQ